MPKRLFRSDTNKVIAGVCGGLGEYFDLDPILVRLILVMTFFVHGFGLLAYIVAWILVPRQSTVAAEAKETPSATASPELTPPSRSAWHSLMPGILLVAFGVFLLLREYCWWFSFGNLWPLLLIAIGIGLILYKGTHRSSRESVTANGENGGSIL